MTKIKTTREVDNLESKVLELENHKRFLISDEFMELSADDKMKSFLELEVKNKEIKRLKRLIDGQLKMIQDDGKLYLGEILARDKVKFGSNTAIYSPTGSGKSTVIEDRLSTLKGHHLLLVSTSNLKKTFLVEFGNSDMNIYTTQCKEKYEGKEIRTYLMTYSELSGLIKSRNDFVEKFNEIHCDEIHSLYDYSEYKSKNPLTHAIKYLFNKQENKQIFYYTATREKMDILNSKQPGIFDDVVFLDYLNHPEIKRYYVHSLYGFRHLEQTRVHLKALRKGNLNKKEYAESVIYGPKQKRSVDKADSKGFAYARTISSMKVMEKVLIEEGFTPLLLWSENNKDYVLSEEQVKADKELIETNKIPEGYDFLIINSAYREGWGLKDPSVKLVIINTTDETDHIQALGRLRQDTSILLSRDNDSEETEVDKDVVGNKVNKPLTAKDKDILCEELGIFSKNGVPAKWKTIKILLENNGYEIKDTSVRINGKGTRVSIIKVK